MKTSKLHLSQLKSITSRALAAGLACAALAQAAPVTSGNSPLNLIPWPKSVQMGAGGMALKASARIVTADPRLMPLAAVFKPLLVESEETLEREAVGYYRTIKHSDLPTDCKASLLEVFESWLEQRLKHKGKKEIEMMLLGELPELEETQSAKDLIRIGEQRGEQRGVQRGLEKAILVYLRARHGAVPVTLQEQIHTLTTDEAERLLEYLPGCQTLDELGQWLASRQS